MKRFVRSLTYAIPMILFGLVFLVPMAPPTNAQSPTAVPGTKIFTLMTAKATVGGSAIAAAPPGATTVTVRVHGTAATTSVWEIQQSLDGVGWTTIGPSYANTGAAGVVAKGNALPYTRVYIRTISGGSLNAEATFGPGKATTWLAGPTKTATPTVTPTPT